MIIRIKTKTEIMWIIVFLFLLKTYVLKAESFFLCCCAIIGLYTIKKKKIVFPRIPGLLVYIGSLIIATFVGITRYPITMVERDVFYEVFSILYIFIGYYCFDYYKDREKSLWKTVCLTLFITSAVCMVQGLFSVTGGADFMTFRSDFSQNVISISMIIPLLFGKLFVFKEPTFSTVKDTLLLILWGAQALLNLSRMSIVNILFGIVLVLICALYKKVINTKNTFKIASIILCLLVAGVVFIKIMPDEATDRFGEKFENTLVEINADNEYDSLSSAQSDWRGYEIQCAEEQWRKNNFLEMIFGEGNGKLINIHFIPDQWKETAEIQNGKTGVTVLHNTYYTLLVKGGIIAVAALITMLFVSIIKAIKNMKRANKKNIWYSTIVITIVILISIDAYVVRNMMDKGSEMTMLMLFGNIIAEMNNRGKVEVIDEKF